MLPKQAFGFVLIATSLIGTCRAQLKDGCKLETVRECGEDYVPYGKGPSVPVSGKALNDKCVTWKQSLSCATQYYNECLEGVSHIVAAAVVKPIQELTAAVCNVGSEQNKEYEKTTPCLNSVGEKLHACFTNIKGDLNRALAKAPAKQVLPHTCCSYNDAVHCFEQALAPCESAGGKRYFLSIIEKVFGSALKLACLDHTKGIEACKSLAKLPPVGPNDHKFDSYAELFIAIASHLGE